MIRKFIAILAIIFGFITGPNKIYAAEHIIVYGDQSYAPYCFMQNGTYDGIYVRILNTAFSRMDDYEVTIKALPWKRLLLGLERGKIFAIFPPYYRPKLRPWIDVYSVPILEEGYDLYCRKNILITPRPNWPEDYMDLQIGTNLGYAVPKINGLIHQESASSNQNVKKLLQGKIDCYANNERSTLYLIKQLGGNQSIVKKGAQISYDHGYLAFSEKNNPPYKNDFIHKFNEIIIQMQKNGEIESIVDQFMH